MDTGGADASLSHAKESGRGVCVLIAARNAESTIGRAVASALREPQVVEVVVVDDASEDGTGRAAALAADGSSRFQLIRQERCGGPSRARNAAIAVSRAPILCVLDADDYFLEGRIGRLLRTAGPDWDLAADDVIMVRDGAATDVGRLLGAVAVRPLTLEAFVNGNVRHASLRRRELGFLKPLIRRAFLDAHALRYREAMFLGEDYALYVEALARGGRFLLTSACGYVAVERGDSLSGRHRTGDLASIVSFDDAMLSGMHALTPPQRAALVAHRAATRGKWQHRRVLDRRRAAGYLAALGEFARAPSTWLHILDATARAKARSLGLRSGPDVALREPRLLVGE